MLRLTIVLSVLLSTVSPCLPAGTAGRKQSNQCYAERVAGDAAAQFGDPEFHGHTGYAFAGREPIPNSPD